MKHLLKLSALLSLLLLPVPSAHAQVSFGFSFGTPPPPPRVYRVLPQPAPEYQWVEGYWYPINGRWAWHDGYWTRSPFPNRIGSNRIGKADGISRAIGQRLAVTTITIIVGMGIGIGIGTASGGSTATTTTVTGGSHIRRTLIVG